MPGHELERVEGEGEKQLAVGEEEQGARGLGRERDELPDLEHQSPLVRGWMLPPIGRGLRLLPRRLLLRVPLPYEKTST